MVLITIVFMGFINQLITGGPHLVHKWSMLECALLFDEQTSRKSIGKIMKFGPGFFCGDRWGWLSDWTTLPPSLPIYLPKTSGWNNHYLHELYWKIHDVFKQRPQGKPFMRPCSMQHPAFNRSSRRPGVESSPCVFVSEELGKAEKFD